MSGGEEGVEQKWLAAAGKVVQKPLDVTSNQSVVDAFVGAAATGEETN